MNIERLIMIAGVDTQRVKHWITLPVVRRVHQLGHTVIVGDNPKGVDMAVVEECRRLKAKVLVVGITNRPRNGGAAHTAATSRSSATPTAPQATCLPTIMGADHWMVDNAQFGVFGMERRQQRCEVWLRLHGEPPEEAHLITFALKGVRHG